MSQPLQHYTGTASGKAIVVGEHYVMDGALALAMALPTLQTKVTWTQTQHNPTSLHIGPPAKCPVSTMQTLLDAAQMYELKGQWNVEIESSLPIGRGLGSSAALCVAALRGLHQGAPNKPNDTLLLHQARELESLFHGSSSGLDPAAASSEGALLFKDGQILRSLEIHPNLASARWILLDLGNSQSTKTAIDRANKHRVTLGKATLAGLTKIVTFAANQAAEALEHGQLQDLAEALRKAGAAMQPLGVVDEAMQQVILTAIDAGALACKQTGAGLGGMLLALAADEPAAHKVAAACRDRIVGHWIVPLTTA